MLAKRIIPCLDVEGGRVVKGTNFVNLKDAGDPVEVARTYDAQSADEICFLDITASSDQRDIILNVVEATARYIFIPLTVGGGVRKLEDIRRLLSAGADKVSINSAAVSDPDFVRRAARMFGSQCIVVAVDAKRTKDSWEIFTHGGRRPAGINAISWVEQMAEHGAGEILLTSMDKDGTKAGYDLELTRQVSRSVPIPVIASGGAGTLSHLYDGFVTGEADAVLAASIFHYKEYTVGDVKTYLHDKGVEVRLC